MSKNSGQRRAAKLKKESEKRKASEKKRQRLGGDDGAILLELRSWLARHRPADVLGAILASELWLPNIGAQVKHGFVYRVFVSMAAEDFAGASSIESHEEFKRFLKGVFDRTPSFPMLEDYVPELDWGFVKTTVGPELVRMFYSGFLERIPDFVEAFRVKYDGCGEPLDDMDVVLRSQDYLLEKMSQVHPEAVTQAAPGYREVPPAFFWESARAVLAGLGEFLNDLKINPDLICELGTAKPLQSLREFGNTLMEGQLMPAPFIRIGSTLFPIFPRNTAGWVIDQWEAKPANARRNTLDVARGISSFLAVRFEPTQIQAGPYRIVRRDGLALPFAFAGFFIEGDALGLIVVANADELEELPQCYELIEKTVSSSVEWGFRQEDGTVFSIDLRNGQGLSSLKLKLVVVVPSVSTAAVMLKIKPSPAKLMYLSDFVAVFDALESVAELFEFWKFVEDEKKRGALGLGVTDMFGTFRQSHGLINDGAREYNLVMLDPHTGSYWRFEELKKFWDDAPPCFPDDSPRSWKIAGSSVIWRLDCKPRGGVARSALLGRCSLHFVTEFESGLDLLDVKALGMFCECVADTVATRQDILKSLPLSANSRIVTHVKAQHPRRETAAEIHQSLLSNWEMKEVGPGDFRINVVLDTTTTVDGFQSASDGSFETGLASQWIKGSSAALELEVLASAMDALEATSDRKPRFTMSFEQRAIDVPDYASPKYPRPNEFKVARQQLAKEFSNAGVEPGRYELAEAKAVISPVLSNFRDQVRVDILNFDSEEILQFAVAQFDALLANNNQQMRRVQLSQAHEVDYDRNQHVVESHTEFIRRSNNFRYLIEATLSLNARPSAETNDHKAQFTEQAALLLLAKIDWLLVLYDSNNALHYAVQAGGIEIDDSFVPQVFYATSEHDEAMQEEQAVEVLGTGLNREDEPDRMSEEERARLDDAFTEDAKFSLTTLLSMLGVLRHWRRVNGRDDMALSYTATEVELIDTAARVFPELDREHLRSALSFLTIDAATILKLTGITEPAADVPFWEHRKRPQRISIRPVIKLDNGALLWGAACADRSARIWSGTFSDGYPPADFSWPHVDVVVGQVKKRIEKQIEDRAFQVIKRFTPYVEKNVNLSKRFKGQGFEDLGDYDVLAWLPEQKKWLAVEAKYNKPPFTVKDSIRLRDEIFGPGGQMFKTSRRVQFLNENVARIGALMGWPVAEDLEWEVVDLYVCPRIMYWMRNPPNPVETQFVRLASLETWMADNGGEAKEG